MIAHSSDQQLESEVTGDDDVFDALADGQRRRLLVDLLDSDPQRVSDLSDTSRELIEANEALLEEVLSGQLEVSGADPELIQKHHVHLPKLAEYGFVEWKSEDCLVTRGARFDELEPILEWIENQRTGRQVTDPVADFLE